MRRAAILLAVLAVLALLPSIASAASGSCQDMKRRLVYGGGAASGLFVVDAETGKPICARTAKRPRILASNTKLFTTSTALSRFGPEYRVVTKLLADGTIGPGGMLRGNLYLQGAGDPALGVPSFYDRYGGGLGTNLLALVGQLREAGVRQVTGRLYADDSVFDRVRGVADSGYATSPYIGPLSGLSFDSGYRGSISEGFADDPATLAAQKLAAALRSAGIAIRTQVARSVTPAGAEALGSVRSPTMSQLVETTDVYSNNFFAEMLAKLLGAHFGGAGTTAAGTAVVERFARSHGSGIQAVDGSGLTRGNRASPFQVAGLLEAIRQAPIGDEFIQDLALAGHEGTVADRMHGTAAYGRCRTKTGTLTGVSALSGICFNRSGRTMIFSILMNGVADLSLAHYEQDKIAAAVASY
ncbi:MAG TPA: D-alanyl-D-alanine carboxypeptidase/D-alanyl-D-alanine-endopeptidase [Solirubrobacterales bacterium]|jgi:D-alanyl-D-alanine carboxypeptidase/D-alanyl-D-alanine-endopeptidase (penicillin-binding protein 4)|nr:D-alanyl-D-alanine carboxypeptidase/D-alanyl-D-alanine-endopeptidase [Solirubrobacterales bacterium]